MFNDVLPDSPAAERRAMFGYPCCFANGNMFAGLHQENVILRLSESERAELLRVPGAAVFEPMAGRPMREYVVVPPSVLAAPAELKTWVSRAFAYAASMPAKGKKAAKKPAAKKPAAKKPAAKKPRRG